MKGKVVQGSWLYFTEAFSKAQEQAILRQNNEKFNRRPALPDSNLFSELKLKKEFRKVKA